MGCENEQKMKMQAEVLDQQGPQRSRGLGLLGMVTV